MRSGQGGFIEQISVFEEGIDRQDDATYMTRAQVDAAAGSTERRESRVMTPGESSTTQQQPAAPVVVVQTSQYCSIALGLVLLKSLNGVNAVNAASGRLALVV